MVKRQQKFDPTHLTYYQMSRIVRAIWHEVKRRNPLWVNMAEAAFMATINELVIFGRGKHASKGYDEADLL